MFKKLFKEEKGFTMIELIIVIAIIGIIGAIVAPNFGTTTAKARLSADLASVRTIQKLTEQYLAEHEPDSLDGTEGDAFDAQDVIGALIDSGSLKASDLKTDGDEYIPQSEKCKWHWEVGTREFKLDYTDVTSTDLLNIIDKLPEEQDDLVRKDA